MNRYAYVGGIFAAFWLLLVQLSGADHRVRLGVQGLTASGAEGAPANLEILLTLWDEPTPENYNWDANVHGAKDITAHLKEAKKAGSTVAITIGVVHMEKSQMPAYLKDRAFDDKYVLERWEKYLGGFLDRNGEFIDYLAIGNEIDWYFSLNRDKFSGYPAFLQRASAVAKAKYPGIKVGVVMQSAHVKDWWPALKEHSDFLGATYYANDEVFSKGDMKTVDPESPKYFGKLLDKVLAEAGRDVLFTEVGCASSEHVGSSLELQASFVRQFFTWLQRNKDKVAGVEWLGVQDWNYEGTKIALQSQLSPELLSNEAFMGFLTSLGLKDENGKPKPAWTEWVKQAKLVAGAN